MQAGLAEGLLLTIDSHETYKPAQGQVPNCVNPSSTPDPAQTLILISCLQADPVEALLLSMDSHDTYKPEHVRQGGGGGIWASALAGEMLKGNSPFEGRHANARGKPWRWQSMRQPC